MNDQLNNITKPINITEIFHLFLKIVTKLYNVVVPKSVRERKNKDKTKKKL